MIEPKKYNEIFESIEADIDLIDERVKLANSAGGGSRFSCYDPQAVSKAIAELLKAKAQLLIALKAG